MSGINPVGHRNCRANESTSSRAAAAPPARRRRPGTHARVRLRSLSGGAPHASLTRAAVCGGGTRSRMLRSAPSAQRPAAISTTPLGSGRSPQTSSPAGAALAERGRRRSGIHASIRLALAHRIVGCVKRTRGRTASCPGRDGPRVASSLTLDATYALRVHHHSCRRRATGAGSRNPAATILRAHASAFLGPGYFDRTASDPAGA